MPTAPSGPAGARAAPARARCRSRCRRSGSAARSGTRPAGRAGRAGGPGSPSAGPGGSPRPRAAAARRAAPPCTDAPGLSKRSSVVACSTTWPAYMTMMSSAASATTPMSCVMMIIAISCSCAEVVEQVEHGGLDGDVERGRRLVGDQQLRVARECDRDHHALAHAAREAVRVVAQPLGGARDAHLLEQLDRLLVRLLLRHVVVPSDRLRDLRPDRQRRVERRHRVLEDHRDLAAAHVLELLARTASSARDLRSGPSRRRSSPAASGSGP